MTQAQLISCEYLKQNTSIENAVDDTHLTPIIEMAQITHIQQALGSAYYDEIISQIVAGNLTAVNENLVRNFIQPMLAKWAEYEAVPVLAFSLTNKSLLVRTDSNADKTSLDEIKYFRNSIRDNAEYLTKRLNRELQINMTLYPTWASQNSLQNVRRNSRSYFSGMYLRKGYDDCSYGEDRPKK